MKSVNIEINNIGGLAGKHNLTFKQGLNTIKAGNAVGKTSAQKALELLALKNQDLKGGKHYANLFGDQTASIKATGSIQCERKFRVVGDDLLEAGGEPLVDTGKGYISGICFATPENPLIAEMLKGRSIKSFIQRFSDSENYDVAVSILDDINDTVARKLAVYRDAIAKIDETASTIELLGKDKNGIEEQLKKLPKIDVATVMKDLKAFEKAFAEKKQIMNNLSEAKATLNSTRDIIDDYKNAIKHLQSELDSLNKKHPKIDERLKKLSDEIPGAKDVIDKLIRKIDRFEDDMKLIDENTTIRVKFSDNGNICHACGRKWTAEELQKYKAYIEEKLSATRKELKTKERELEDLEDERKELQDTEEKIGQQEQEKKEKSTTLAHYEEDESKLQKKITKLSEEEDVMQKKIKEMSKNEDAFRKYQEKDRLETQLNEKEKTIEQAEKRLKTLKGEIIDVESLQTKKDFLDSAIVYMKKRQEEIIDAVRVKFNNTINALYKKMGFKNVEDISITRDYSITVTKKDKGKEVEDFPLVALSASERVTLGVALLVTAKQEYLPDFPFFVMDEIVTSYDPKRFEQIKDFVKNVTDYVVVTQVSKEDGIMVEHEA